MFVPIVPSVPSVPHTTVINKTIVYSDTILSLKDTGNNLKVTTISDVSEFSLESCLKTIFESNHNVIFNTIQYSKNDKKVYFYTNQNITTKVYEESKFTKYKPITSKNEILEELKRLLLVPKNMDNSCISLYDVLILLRKLNVEQESIENRYKDALNYIVESKFDSRSLVIFYEFDYQKKILHISFRMYGCSSFDDIYFAKQNGDLYTLKSESCYTDEVFSALGSTLSNMYDELLKYNDYNDFLQYKENVKPVNSNFNVNISRYEVTLSTNNNEFILCAPTYTNEYNLKCNSNIINEAFLGKKDEVFKRIYVRIEDCPEWSQTMLYEIRQNQLAEEQKIEDEIKYKEMKKQKRLELKRKIFPFLRK